MKRIRKLAVAALFLCGASHGAPEPFHRIPEADRGLLGRVAAEYKLTAEQRRLLFAIYMAEGNTKDRAAGLLDGKEMGVMTPAAQRYKGDNAKSLELQAKYACGTIAKRYTGDLAAFAKRWAPVGAENDKHNKNEHWLKNVQQFMKKGQ